MKRSRILVLLWCMAGVASADVPAVRNVGTEQGLRHPRVERIVSDSRGLLWFCTAGALSAYDGARMRHFNAEWLMKEHEFHDIAEAPDGSLWVAIWRGGLARIDPDSNEGLKAVDDSPTATPRRLLFDQAGRLWLASDDGLFLKEQGGSFEPVAGIDDLLWDLELDAEGRLWVATATRGVLRLDQAGSVQPVPVVAGEKQPRILALARSRKGTMWVGHDLGVSEITAEGALERRITGSQLGENVVVDVFESKHGDIWIASARTVSRWTPDGLHGVDVGGSRHYPRRFAEDIGGRLWMGTMTGGAYTWPTGGISPYLERDGLAFSRKAYLTRDRSGRAVAATGATVHVYVDGTFRTVRPPLLAGHDSGRLIDNVSLLHASDGRWWLGTKSGLYVTNATDVWGLETVPVRRMPIDDLTGEGRVLTLHESDDGWIWIGTADGAVLRQRGQETERFVSPEPSLSSIRRFVRSTAGELWVVGEERVARIDGEDGKLEIVRSLDDTGPMDLLFEDGGRTWAAVRNGGLFVADTPDLAFRRWDSLPRRESARCLRRSASGELFVGTKTGLLRIDPEANVVRRYGEQDGLSNLELMNALDAGDGTLWFAAERGLNRVDTRRLDEPNRDPLTIWLERVRIGGRAQPLASLGVSAMGGRVVGSGNVAVEVEFGALSFDPNDPTRFQYRVRGSDPTWSEPSVRRSVTLVGLRPGSYELEVRATRAGRHSDVPARLQFRVKAPWWRRPGFLLLVAAAVALTGILVVRMRLRRMRELNEIRLRIATDLHDEIGSGLSQISVLSAVTRERLESGDERITTPIERIGAVSRDLVDGMAEIVWAISPQRDAARDLVRHMRRFAADSLENEQTRLTFTAVDCEDDRVVGPQLRRELSLMLKESIHNIVKHAEAENVRVEIRRERATWRLTIEDDGQGFDPEAIEPGHGLASLRTRARRLRGSVRIDGAPGRGTRVEVVVPAKRGGMG